MNAKSKLSFINSLAGRQKVPCPACNSLNDTDACFCAICGTKLFDKDTQGENSRKVICPACSEPNENDAVFCASCGTKLKGEGEKKTSVIEPVEAKYVSEAEGRMDAEAEGNPGAKGELPQAPEAGQKQNLGEEQQRTKKTPAFSSVKKSAKDIYAVPVPRKHEELEEISVFAQGLPAWDIVPPQVVVRRKKR